MSVNRKFNSGVFKLRLCREICVQKLKTVQYMRGNSPCVQAVSLYLNPSMGVHADWDSGGREDTICIFRARTDHYITILMPKKSQRNFCWWLFGSIPVSFSPKNANCYPFHSTLWFDQASPCWDSCPWPSLPSPGSVHAMVTHVQTLHPDVSPPISLTSITGTLYFDSCFPHYEVWQNLCYLRQWPAARTGRSDEARRNLFPLLESSAPMELPPGILLWQQERWLQILEEIGWD